jgi:hypothetical protein
MLPLFSYNLQVGTTSICTRNFASQIHVLYLRNIFGLKIRKNASIDTQDMLLSLTRQDVSLYE